MGHDREPYFLKEQAFKEWTTPEPKKKTELFKILEGGLEVPEFEAKKFRALKRKTPKG